MAFTNHGSYVTDETSGLNWKTAPTARLLWGTAVANIPTGWRIPTLNEMQSLIANQKAELASCTAAFGADNLPTDFFWVHKIDPAREDLWQASGKSEAEAEDLSLEKPGHVAAYFVWMGFTPINRRMEQALCRYVQI